MEWTESLKRALTYMEEHLLEEIGVEEVADFVYMSPFYLQKGFSIMTGYSVGEYLRQRRLYLAAIDVATGRHKVIDLALKYGYQTPESFTKAFSRFHGVPPMQLKGDTKKIKVFLPLKITVSIQGGNEMDFSIKKMDDIPVIGIERVVSYETAYQEIPRFWDDFCRQFMSGKSTGKQKQVVERCKVGEYGICIDDAGESGQFRYMIAGKYDGGEIPEGMTVFAVPAASWAKFQCCGPLPGALQSVNTKIYHEWLPGNPDYKLSMGINIEWYSIGDTSAIDYESAIWFPVKKK